MFISSKLRPLHNTQASHATVDVSSIVLPWSNYLILYWQMTEEEKNESLNEVEVLSKMSHPNIVQYKESFEGIHPTQRC